MQKILSMPYAKEALTVIAIFLVCLIGLAVSKLKMRRRHRREEALRKAEDEKRSKKEELRRLLDGRVVRVVARYSDNATSWAETNLNDLLIGAGVNVELVLHRKGNQIAVSEDNYPKDGILILCRVTHSHRMGVHVINCDGGKLVCSSQVAVSEFYPEELAAKALEEIHAKLKSREALLKEGLSPGKAPVGTRVSI